MTTRTEEAEAARELWITQRIAEGATPDEVAHMRRRIEAEFPVTTGKLDEYGIPDYLRLRLPQDLTVTSRSWTPRYVDDILDGSFVPAKATVGRRSDGVGIFYRGKVNEVAAEPEGGKSWLTLLSAAQEIAAGNRVVYLDFEDDEAGIIGRLMMMGANVDDIRDHFAYVRPTSPLMAVSEGHPNHEDLRDLLYLAPTLVVVDGVTEAMSLHDFDLNDNADVARFEQQLTRNIANTKMAPAVVKTDHVIKNAEGRGRWSLGGGHKLAGLNGAAYRLENRTPFGIGRTGKSSVKIAKDRAGAVRQHAISTTGAMLWLGDLVVESLAPTAVEVSFIPPEAKADNFRPTTLMGKVSQALSGAAEPLSGRGIQDRVGSQAKDVRAATAALVDEGFVTIEDGPRGAKLHRLVRPFADLL